VLVVVIYIMASAGAVDLSNRKVAYLSLASVLNNLDVEPDVRVLRICPACQEPYPAYRPGPFLCNRCQTPVFTETLSNDPRKKNARRIVKPALQCPYISIETQLRSILAVPGMIKAMDQWRPVMRQAGRYKDMFDGYVAKHVKAPDGTPFFQNPAPPKELRIGLVLGFDW
jgi:hypothetical protein